jgi:hypothetical protein
VRILQGSLVKPALYCRVPPTTRKDIKMEVLTLGEIRITRQVREWAARKGLTEKLQFLQFLHGLKEGVGEKDVISSHSLMALEGYHEVILIVTEKRHRSTTILFQEDYWIKMD